MCGVPLLVGDETIGVLHVGVLKHRKFTTEDVELLLLVAARVALAIERARLHDETVLLDSLKTNFVAIASHELRTPAASVYGVLKTLASRGDQLSPEVRDELMRTGVEQGERLRRLLEELLDLSRLDSRVITIAPRPIVVRTLLEELVRVAMPAGMSISLDVADDLAAVADRVVVDRVVSNLLMNAVRYGAPPFVLAAEQRDRILRISVCDDGPGIPDELSSRLFERFARGSDAPGSGLGLAISRSYARAHGGDLVYRPTERGTRFDLILPQG